MAKISTKPSNIIAIALSASAGAVMMFTCRQVGSAKAKFSRYVLDQSFISSNIRLINAYDLATREFDVPVDAPAQYQGKDVIVGPKGEQFALDGKVITVSDFPTIKFDRMNRSTDELVVNDIDAIMFVDSTKQAATGTNSVESYMADLIDPIEVNDAKQGFDLLRKRLNLALEALQEAENRYDAAGFLEGRHSFCFAASEGQDHEVRLRVTGAVSQIKAGEVSTRIESTLRKNRIDAFELREKLAQKARLEAELTKLNGEIAERS